MRDYYGEIRNLDRAELLKLLQESQQKSSNIKSQVMRARVDYGHSGERADPSWYVRANDAGRHIGRTIVAIQRRLSELKVEQKAANIAAQQDLDRSFVVVARLELGQEMFEALMEKARVRVERQRRLYQQEGEEHTNG